MNWEAEMIIGITGGSGTGKSTLSHLLNGVVVDADKVYHELLETNDSLKAELIDEFGTCNRKNLASIVFTDKIKLQKLDSITFKYILSAIEGKIKSVENVVLDATLLFESGLDAKCDVTIAIIAKKDLRIRRIMERDRLTNEQAEKRINAQKPDEFYIKSADHIVHNNGGDLTLLVDRFKKEILLQK
jgi:dephospho-CoA kinase